MKMTSQQLITILFGIILIVAMGLYPPWRVEAGRSSRTLRACAYGSLFSPPQTVRIWYSGALSVPPGMESVHCRAIGLDMYRLLVQWAVVALAVAGAFVIQELAKCFRRESGAPPRPPSISSKTGLR